MVDHQKKRSVLQAVLIVFITSTFIMSGSSTLVNLTKDDTFSSRFPFITSTTLYVDDDNTAGPWEGTLEHPYQFIQEAIDHAQDEYQIYVFNGTYHEHVTVFKSLDITGEEKHTTVIDGGKDGTVVKITACHVTLTGFTIKKSGSQSNNAGIMIHSQQNTIVENIITKNYYGIYAMDSNNLLYHNNFNDNIYPAYDACMNVWDQGYPCGGNYWSDYTGVDGDEDGIGDTPYPLMGNTTSDRYPLIHPYGSVMNINTEEIFLTIQQAIADPDTIADHEIMVKNGRYDEHITLFKPIVITGEDAKKTIIDGRNTETVVTICADSATLKTCTIQHSGTEEYDAGVLITKDTITLMDTFIQDNYQGLVMKQCADENLITRNIICNNLWNGISLKNGCTGNLIEENTIRNNRYAGIGVSDASNNFLYHNNLIDNLFNAYDDSNNIWDDGYPSGGNYWSDYTGVDGNEDGIGDTPYYILDGINKDRYPFMESYTSEDTTPPVVSIVAPQNGLYLKNLRFFPRILRHRTILFGSPTIKVDAVDARSGIQKVEFYVDDQVHPKATVFDPPYEWTWNEHSFLRHQHVIIVVAYDNAGNTNYDWMNVRRFF